VDLGELARHREDGDTYVGELRAGERKGHVHGGEGLLAADHHPHVDLLPTHEAGQHRVDACLQPAVEHRIRRYGAGRRRRRG